MSTIPTVLREETRKGCKSFKWKEQMLLSV